MGLLTPVAEFIVAEHSYRKITGDVLFIGRQTTFQDEQSLGRLLRKYDLSVPSGFTYEYDTETRGGTAGRYLTDRCIMRALGVTKINFLDVTAYEGADIVHDLGCPIPDSLVERFDFIYNGGCLDNMFNPGMALMNLSKMLKPSGRVVCFESVSSRCSPYLMYSPGWFWDYYVVNGFADCKVYLGSYCDNDAFTFGPWDWFFANPDASGCSEDEKNGPPPAARENNNLLLVCLAEKGAQSTSERQPIQFQYRVDDALRRECAEKAKVIAASPRPLVGQRPANAHGYLMCLGKMGAGVHRRPLVRSIAMGILTRLRAMRVIARILFRRAVV